MAGAGAFEAVVAGRELVDEGLDFDVVEDFEEDDDEELRRLRRPEVLLPNPEDP